MGTDIDLCFFFPQESQKLTYKDTLALLEKMNQSSETDEKWRMLEKDELQQLARGPTEGKALFTSKMYWCKPSGDGESEAVIMNTGVSSHFNITNQMHMGVVFVKA
jgi:hypothetical protein